MDPITGVVALTGLTVAALTGLRLKKQLNEGFKVLPSEQGDGYDKSVEVSQTRYNPLMSMVNPILNPILPGNATEEQVKARQGDLNQTLGSLLSPYDPTSPEAFKLKDMMNRLKIRSDPKGGLFNAVKFCREAVAGDGVTKGTDTPFTIYQRNENGDFELDANGNPMVKTPGVKQRMSQDEEFKFDEICGVCLTSGIDEEGKPFNGKRGMLVDPSAKDSALKEKDEFQYPFPRVTPSMGKCEGAPNSPAFAIDNTTLQQYSMRNECMKSKEIKEIDKDNTCGLCFENNVFSYVPKKVQKNTINLVLMGIGRCTITANNVSVKNNVILNDKTAVSIPLITSQDVRVYNKSLGKWEDIKRVLPVSEGSQFRIEVIEDPTRVDDIPIVWGYMRSTNPNGGEFAMPLNLLLTRDDETNAPPNRTGGFHKFPENEIEVSKIRPGGSTGRTMKLVGEVPFTFVQPSEFSSFDCPSAPYQIDTKSVNRFASDQPCYAKGSGKGNYNDECLRERILAVGCTNGGDLYKDPRKLNLNNMGQPASLTEIYNVLQNVAANNMLDPDMTKLCSGKVISSPCDFFTQQPDLKMKPILDGSDRNNTRIKPSVLKCLSHLYNNKGAEDELKGGPTYEGPEKYANDTKETKKLFCLPTGQLNPDRSNEAALELATIYDNGFERARGVDGVKRYLNSFLQMAIDEKRNGNTDPDRRAAIRKCFGTEFTPLQVRQLQTGNPSVQNDPPKYIISDSQNRQWRMTSDKRIRLTQGTPIEVDLVARSDGFKSNEGRVALFIDGNPAEAIRQSGLLLVSNPFVANTADFAWYPIRSTGTSVMFYNDFAGGYLIGYDIPTDSVLIVRPGDSRAVSWQITPFPATFVRNEPSLVNAPSPRIAFAWYGTVYKGIGANVTSVVQTALNSGASQIIVSSGTLGTDPVPGATKRLWIDYVPAFSETTKQFTAEEGTTVRITQLTNTLPDAPAVTPPQDRLPTEFTPALNQQLGTAWSNGDYELSMEILPFRMIWGDWGSIVQFTATGGQCCNPGDRIPGVWFWPSTLRLHVRVGDTTDGNWGVDTATSCTMGQWNRVILVCRGNAVSLRLNNEQINVTQPTTRPRGVAAVWSRFSNTPAGVQVRNFRFRSLN